MGVSSEKVMDASVENVSELLETIKGAHPDIYKKFMNQQHELMLGPHYNDELAEEAVGALEYTDAEGKHQIGPHWSKQDVLRVTKGKSFPSGTTDCDLYVAYNAAYADFCKKFDDDDILDIAYLFFFADEDWKGGGKIWKYMLAKS